MDTQNSFLSEVTQCSDEFIENHKPIPILLPYNGKFKFDEEALYKTIDKNEVGNLPAVVISVAGAFRKGKSFLLNFLLKYLNTDDKQNWLGSPEKSLEGFSWRGGSERDTSGILLWSNIFKVDLPDGETVAVLLMDTQGAFDGESTMQECVTIFSLSTLLSSIQIYNLSQHIQENDLEHLQLFTEYGKLALTNSQCKPFQSLMFLIRDWSYPYQYEYGEKGGFQLLEKKINFFADKHSDLQEVRNHIHSCFDELLCYLMPHPGLKVACDPNFKGQIKDVEEQFREHIFNLAPLLLAPKNLKKKEVNGITVTCNELLEYFKSYVKMYDENDFPKPKTLLEATAEASNMTILNKCVDSYTKLMDNCREKFPYFINAEYLKNYHEGYKNNVLKKFDGMKKLGSEDKLLDYRNNLTKQIDERFEGYEARNEAKKSLCAFKTPIVLGTCIVIGYIFSALLSCLWIFLPLSDLFGYICLCSSIALLTWILFSAFDDYIIYKEIIDRACFAIWNLFFVSTSTLSECL